MANRLLTRWEANCKIVAPWLRMVADSFEAQPLEDGAARDFRSPLGAYDGPVVFMQGDARMVAVLRELADRLTGAPRP